LAGHKFGIHARTGEAFGIAVAEMAKAGCIPFVHQEGGPAEIVSHPLLSYRNIDEAATKIDRVLRDHPLQDQLHEHVKHQGQRFSAESYTSGIRAVVARFLKRSRKEAA